MAKPFIVALVGPTGVGKTRTSLFLAKELNGEIVSMDSMQVYRNMNIGTAKSTLEERAVVPHHMIDVVDPHERFTTADYQKMAFQSIQSILSYGRLPLLVGGTGLYLDAIRYDMRLGESKADDEIREKLRNIAQQPDGQNILHAMLEKVDPETADKLHPNDIRRVMRALEIYEISGKTKSQQADSGKKEGRYHVLVYGLSLPREMMYARINARVDEMMQAGLVEEVKTLLDSGVEPAQAIKKSLVHCVEKSHWSAQLSLSSKTPAGMQSVNGLGSGMICQRAGLTIRSIQAVMRLNRLYFIRLRKISGSINNTKELNLKKGHKIKQLCF